MQVFVMRTLALFLYTIFITSVNIYADGERKILVKVSKPEIMDLYDTYGVLGECRNTVSKDIFSKIAGTITKITKNEGDFVQKGEVILAVNYNNYEVLAPFDGIIGTISYKINQDVKIGDFLVSIISGNEKDIIFNVPEKILKRLSKDSELYIKDSEASFTKAQILSKSPYLNASGNSLIKASIISETLTHGSFVNGELRYNHHKGLVVPEYTVLKSAKSDYIYVKNQQNKAVKVLVTTGSKLNDMVEITGAEVNQGMNVVVEGLTSIYEFATLEEASDQNTKDKSKQ